VPRRTRKRMVGKWEQVERAAREDELTELERELRGKQHGQKPKAKGRHHRQRGTEPGAPYGTAPDNDTDSASDG